MYAARWGCDSPIGNHQAVHAPGNATSWNVARLGMGYTVAGGIVVRPSVLAGFVWTSWVHRQFALDRSRTKVVGDAADESHMASSRVTTDSPGSAASSRRNRRRARGQAQL